MSLSSLMWASVRRPGTDRRGLACCGPEAEHPARLRFLCSSVSSILLIPVTCTGHPRSAVVTSVPEPGVGGMAGRGCSTPRPGSLGGQGSEQNTCLAASFLKPLTRKYVSWSTQLGGPDGTRFVPRRRCPRIQSCDAQRWEGRWGSRVLHCDQSVQHCPTLGLPVDSVRVFWPLFLDGHVLFSMSCWLPGRLTPSRSWHLAWPGSARGFAIPGRRAQFFLWADACRRR